MMGLNWLTLGGRSYTLDEVTELLTTAGFSKVTVRKLGPSGRDGGDGNPLSSVLPSAFNPRVVLVARGSGVALIAGACIADRFRTSNDPEASSGTMAV